MKNLLLILLSLCLSTAGLLAQQSPDPAKTEREQVQAPRSRSAQAPGQNRPHNRPAVAAERGNRTPDPTERANRLAQFLELDAKQTASLQEFMLSSDAAMRDEMAAAQTPEERATIRQEYRQLTEQKINNLLTPEQKERYEARKASRVAGEVRPARPDGERAQGQRQASESRPEQAGSKEPKKGKSKKPQE